VVVCVDDAFGEGFGEGGRGGRMGGTFHAVWLAYMWATNEGSVDAVSALTRLIVDWPMDFIFIIWGHA
jgi:hypothetical protein